MCEAGALATLHVRGIASAEAVVWFPGGVFGLLSGEREREGEREPHSVSE